MVQRSELLVVFEEILAFLQRLIDHFQCDQHENCLNIGDTQHSTVEARRSIDIFQYVLEKQTIYIMHHPSCLTATYYIVFFAISIDGWSRGICIFFFFSF